MSEVLKVEIKKVAELPDAMNKNRHPVGMTRVGMVKEEHLPEEGHTFALSPLPGERGSFVTSKVTKIISSRSFETMNSRYVWSIVG